MKPFNFAEAFKAHRARLKKTIPTMYDMIHTEREEVIDICIHLIEHEKIHQMSFHVLKNRAPGKQTFNIVHPDWIEWSNKNSKMMDFMKNNPVSNKNSKMMDFMKNNPVPTAINDHVCPHCKNDRVSSIEKSCWLCGGSL